MAQNVVIPLGYAICNVEGSRVRGPEAAKDLKFCSVISDTLGWEAGR